MTEYLDIHIRPPARWRVVAHGDGYVFERHVGADAFEAIAAGSIEAVLSAARLLTGGEYEPSPADWVALLDVESSRAILGPPSTRARGWKR